MPEQDQSEYKRIDSQEEIQVYPNEGGGITIDSTFDGKNVLVVVSRTNLLDFISIVTGACREAGLDV